MPRSYPEPNGWLSRRRYVYCIHRTFGYSTRTQTAMYIRKVEINNIRSIDHFEMTFPEGKEAGWHVLIGENGSGKSTIAKAIAVGLIGRYNTPTLRQNWREWQNMLMQYGYVRLFNNEGSISDYQVGISVGLPDWMRGTVQAKFINSDFSPVNPFCASYGPFRRFSGGSSQWDTVFENSPTVAAHLSLFGEDVALVESIEYIKKLYVRNLDKENLIEQDFDIEAIHSIIKFINVSELLPTKAQIVDVNSETILVRDANKSIIPITQLSDGYRSILSLVLDLLRQLLLRYKSNEIFKNIDTDVPSIDLPGIVIIDEVDAHLHPTWQTKIGQWFTTYFPNFQFIVTTHSPLICRAAEKGSIWKLAAPGSDQPSRELTGIERDRLIYGNILDAYSTEAFGDESVIRSDSANEKLQRLAMLSQLNAYGRLDEAGKQEMQELRKILITDDTTEF
jgi:predicted ATP-binding protein involved in virulence